MKRVTVRIPKDDLDALEDMASGDERQYVNRSEAIRDAIRQLVRE